MPSAACQPVRGALRPAGTRPAACIRPLPVRLAPTQNVRAGGSWHLPVSTAGAGRAQPSLSPRDRFPSSSLQMRADASCEGFQVKLPRAHTQRTNPACPLPYSSWLPPVEPTQHQHRPACPWHRRAQRQAAGRVHTAPSGGRGGCAGESLS